MVTDISNKQNYDSMVNFVFLAVFTLTLVAILSILQDYAHSSRHNYDFYISESLLFKAYWFCNLPTLLLLRLVSKETIISASLFRLFSLVILFSVVHLLVGTTSIWLLSSLAKDIGYPFVKLLNYAVSNNLLVTIGLYCLAFVSYRLLIKGALKRTIDECKVILASPKLRYLQIKQGQRHSRIDVNDIQFIESATPYISIHVDDKMFLYSSSIKKLSGQLDSRFVRVHRSTIVNIEKVLMSQSRLNGDYDLQLSNGANVRLSRTYAKNFKANFITTST